MVEGLEGRRLLAVDLGVEYVEVTEATGTYAGLDGFTFSDDGARTINQRVFSAVEGKLRLADDFVLYYNNANVALDAYRDSLESPLAAHLLGPNGERPTDEQLEQLAGETIVQWKRIGDEDGVAGQLFLQVPDYGVYTATDVRLVDSDEYVSESRTWVEELIRPLKLGERLKPSLLREREIATVSSNHTFVSDGLRDSASLPSVADGVLWYDAPIKRASVIGVSERNDTVYFNFNGQIRKFDPADFDTLHIRGSQRSDRIEIGGRLPGATLIGMGGGDTLLGGSGNDLIHAHHGSLAADKVNFIDAHSGDDRIELYRLPDTSRDVDDTFDTIYAGSGDDVLDMTRSEARAIAFGGSGNDLFIGGDASGGDQFEGGPGSDTLRGGYGNDWLAGGSGDDWLYGDRDDDSLSGGDGNDALFGERGDDLLDGRAGDDVLYGGRESDELHGGHGDDEVWAGPAKWEGSQFSDGYDRLFGQAGNDMIVGNLGFDYAEGGAGDDRLFSRHSNSYIFDYDGIEYSDRFDGGDGYDMFHVDPGPRVAEWRLTRTYLNIEEILPID
ncbi:MAG: calcium-binding protein [Planctomycetota bacterium]